MKKFPLNIEVYEGEPFVSMQDLIDMLEGSMSGKGEQADLYLFNLAAQLKGIRLEALKPQQKEETPCVDQSQSST